MRRPWGASTTKILLKIEIGTTPKPIDSDHRLLLKTAPQSRFLLALAFVPTLLGYPRPKFSQAITGDILGTVTDSTYTVFANAGATLSSVETEAELRAMTGDAGNWLFARLKAGHNRLQASEKGFSGQSDFYH